MLGPLAIQSNKLYHNYTMSRLFTRPYFEITISMRIQSEQLDGYMGTFTPVPKQLCTFQHLESTRVLSRVSLKKIHKTRLFSSNQRGPISVVPEMIICTEDSSHKMIDDGLVCKWLPKVYIKSQGVKEFQWKKRRIFVENVWVKSSGLVGKYVWASFSGHFLWVNSSEYIWVNFSGHFLDEFLRIFFFLLT